MRIKIASFGGVQPNTDARLLPESGAQIAHNCLLDDGSLKAMPQWVVVGDGAFSVSDASASAQFIPYAGFCGQTFYGPPFGTVTIYLDSSGVLQPSVRSSGLGTTTVSPGGLSAKAVNRVYGVTSIVNVGGVDYESALTVVNGANPRQVMYEGDIATTVMTGDGTAMRLYRSTSDVTTGTGANGPTTANWQLVAQIAGQSSTYIDSGAAVADPFDTYLYRGPTQQPFPAFRMGVLGSGYVWLVSEDGQIALSDRFAWGYWPVENGYSLGNAMGNSGVKVTGTASVGDVLYIGTQDGAYACSAHVTEEGGVVLGIVAIPKAEPCLPDTMAATQSGAMYTSVQGIVGLDGERATLLSRSLARGVFGNDIDGTPLQFSAIGNAVYHHGRYYGVSGGLPPPLSISGHLIDGFVGQPVNYQYLVGGGAPPRVVSILAPQFPPSLGIDGNGLTTGLRSLVGKYTWKLLVTDSVGTTADLTDSCTQYDAVIYAANYVNNIVDVVANSNGAHLATVSTPNTPKGMAVSPAQTLVYSANYSANTVSVISVKTNTVIATIPVDVNPYDVCVSKDGTRVYVACQPYAGSVTVIDAVANAVIGSVGFAQPCYSCAANWGNGDIYVISGSTIYVLNPDGTTKTSVGTTNPSGVCASPDGLFFYVVGFDGITCFGANTYARVGGVDIRGGYGPLALVVSPDGNTAYVCDYNYASVAVVDLTNKAMPSVVKFIAMFLSAGIAMDIFGQNVYVSAAGTGLYVIDMATNVMVASYPTYANAGIAVAVVSG